MNRILASAMIALLLPAIGLAQDTASMPPAAFAAPAAQPAPTQATAQAQGQDEPLTERQMALMEARILSRQGDLPKSLKLYDQLRATYPDDQEVYEDFLETLAANAQFERVLYELVNFRKKFGSTSRSERIEAGIYAELKRPQYGLDILERAQRGHPNDIGLWADVGVQRQANRDTSGAIQAFSHVLELDPDNQAAKDALHGLLLEKRPRLEVGVSSYDQGKKNVTTTYSVSQSVGIGESTRMTADVNQVHVKRPDDANPVKQDITVTGVRLEHALTPNLTLEGGLQSYLGLGDGLAPMAGVFYAPEDWGRARLNYAYHLPWYEQAEAANLSGSQDRLRLEYELPFRQDWIAFAGYKRENYRLDDKDFGSRWEATASLSRRLWQNPEVYLTYTFQRAEFVYDKQDYRPFDMIPSELSHMATLSLTKQLAPWLEAGVSVGIKHDYDRSIEAFMFSPKLVYHPIERLRLTLGWDYASEGGTVGGGESNTAYAKIAWIW